MQVVIIIVVIVLIVVYLINKDYKSDLNRNVTGQGGMQAKYQTLIIFLTSTTSGEVSKLTSNHVEITTKNMKFFIDYVGGDTELLVKGVLPLLGNFSNKWKFQVGYPQEKMIKEIENYFDWQLEKLKSLDKEDYYKHLNN